MTTENVKSLIRRGPISSMPLLAPGEFGLATDENRLFIGTDPITASVVDSESNDTIAVMTFSENFNGIVELIDLDNAHVNSFGIEVNNNPVPQGSISVNDTTVTVAHGLNRVLDGTDTFVLKRNKEVTTNSDEKSGTSSLVTTAFEKQQPFGTPESTTIDFDANVKNSITIDYTLEAGGYFYRKGKLDIMIVGTDASAFSTINDTFTTNLDNDFVFSLTHDNAGLFTLNYDTTDTVRHTLTYTQTSVQL